MSTPNKLRPAPDSQLRRLKELPASDRAEIVTWKDEAPSPTNAQIRERIAERFGIGLKRDGQLSEFWQWQFRQAALDHLGTMMSENELLLSDKFPHLTRDQLWDITIKQGYAVANLLNDPKLGLSVAKVDLKDDQATFDRQRYQDLMKSKLQAGLDAVAEAFKGNAKAMEFYQQARQMIDRETA